VRAGARQALLSPRAASVGSRARSPGSNPSPRNEGQTETTICRGWVSQADTHQEENETFWWRINAGRFIQTNTEVPKVF